MRTASLLPRRDFVQFIGAAVAALGLPGCATLVRAPRPPRPIAAGARIRYAQIGCGVRGYRDIMAHADEQLVAFCDVDRGHPNVAKIREAYPDAKYYQDFRRMLVELDDAIDAVGIATPDHMHFLPAYLAIMMGKHVYVQKPLTRTIAEARELHRLARLNGVCTQMGNQGHAGEGIRLVREWIDGGVLGDVREVKIWTNRPNWPQGFAAWPPEEPVPPEMDWNLWLGRAPRQPFSRTIHPQKWRAFHEYGAGALGDMACHLMDAAYWGLRLGAPSRVEIRQASDTSAIAFPQASIVEYQFPARDRMPPVKLTWHDGGIKPERPPQLEESRVLAKGGQLIIGSKATVYDGNDYCNSPRIIPEELHRQLQPGFPPRTLPRPDPVGDPHKEWMRAIRIGDPSAAGSNFDYSVPFTETVALGVMAVRVRRGFTWDAAGMRTSLAAADRLLYPTYRHGWRPGELAADADRLASARGPSVAGMSRSAQKLPRSP